MDRVKIFFRFLSQHKGKFALMSLSSLVFTFLLFPFHELGDLVSSQVSDLSGGQVYLQFENMRMSLFPEAGVALDQVYVEGQGLPPLKSDELIFTPSISSLIYQKPAGTVTAKGFMKGEVEASLKPGTKSENGVERQRITLNAKNLSLGDLRQLAHLPIQMSGQASLSSSALVDLTFQEQPDMDVILKIEHLELPPSNVQTPMGPLTLPDLKLASVELKGRLSAGKLLIEEGSIGKEGDEVRGSVKGNMGLLVQKRKGGRPGNEDVLVPVFSSYSFDIDLTVKKSFQDKANLFLSFIEQYKTPAGENSQYRLRLAAPNFGGPPSMSALR